MLEGSAAGDALTPLGPWCFLLDVIADVLDHSIKIVTKFFIVTLWLMKGILSRSTLQLWIVDPIAFLQNNYLVTIVSRVFSLANFLLESRDGRDNVLLLGDAVAHIGDGQVLVNS